MKRKKKKQKKKTKKKNPLLKKCTLNGKMGMAVASFGRSRPSRQEAAGQAAARRERRCPSPRCPAALPPAPSAAQPCCSTNRPGARRGPVVIGQEKPTLACNEYLNPVAVGQK